jgi:predicted Zn-dependent protease
MLVDEPHDKLLRYGLALELEKTAEHDRSLELLRGLTKEQPPHVPAFFMAAQQLVRLGRVNEARTELREGIEAARVAGDQHAAGEMSEFLASLGQMGE